MTIPSKRLDCEELKTKILLIIKDDHQPALELLTVMPNRLLCVPLPVGSINQGLPRTRIKTSIRFVQSQYKTVEDKGTGEKGRRGEGEGAWGEVRGMQYDYWVGMEGLKVFSSITKELC